MNFDFRDLKIKYQAYIIFGALGLLAFFNFFFINNFRLSFQEESEKIEVAGKTRMLSQRIALLANQVYDGEDHLKAQLIALIEEQENIFRTFEYGGLLPGYNAKINPAKGAGQMSLSKAMATWKGFKGNLDIFLYGNTSQGTTSSAQESITPGVALQKINRSHYTLLADCHSFVETLVVSGNEKKRNLRNALIIFLVANLLAIGGLFYLVINYLFDPLHHISEAAARISSGDLEAKSSYSFKNELGDISKTLNSFVRNLKNATTFVQRIGEGNLDEKLGGMDESDVKENSLEGALLTMRDKLKEVQEEEMARKWSTEGLTQFVDILRSNEANVNELGSKIISKLVDYTNSNQGGLYLLNSDDENNKHLELAALYAFDTKKYEQKTIRLGEGLVGQTFLEKKTTYLLEIPHEYINIVSGLGGANPKAILVVPLILNDEIYGIIELASFNEYRDYEIEFVEKLGESISSTISGVKTNQQTKRLLNESQAMTEQMQAQEEEMRQNMEELTATQEEMARTEKELFARQSAINSNIGVAEFSTNGELLNANKCYTSHLGYSIDELKGMGFAHITTEPSLLENIKTGETTKGWFKKAMRSGDHKEMQSTFSVVPVKDETRIIELIIEFNRPNGKAEGHDLDEVEALLRQQMEELEITQEQLNLKIEQTGNRLDAVDAVFSFISCDLNGLIHDVNDKARSRLEVGNNKLVGSTVDDFFEGIDLAFGKKTLTLKTGEPVEAHIQSAHQHKGENLIFIVWI